MKSKARSGLWLWLIGLGIVVTLMMMLAGPFGRSPSISLTTPTITQGSSASPSATLLGSSTPAGSSLPPITETPTEESTATDWPTPDETATENAIATAVRWNEFIAATAQQILTDQPIQNPPRPTGILETGGDAFPSGLYKIQNSWQDVRDNLWFQAYAGAYVQDPEQGIVIATGVPHDIVFETPIRAGSVRIIDEINFRLTLLAEDGTIFYFDVPGLQFVDSLTEVVPTITPFMSATPTLTHTPHPTDAPLPTCTPGPTPTANPAVPFVCN